MKFVKPLILLLTLTLLSSAPAPSTTTSTTATNSVNLRASAMFAGGDNEKSPEQKNAQKRPVSRSGRNLKRINFRHTDGSVNRYEVRSNHAVLVSTHIQIPQGDVDSSTLPTFSSPSFELPMPF